MKFVLVIAVIVICAGIPQPCFSEDDRAMIHEVSKICQEKEDLQDEDVAKLLNGDYDDGGADEKLMCYTKCMLEKFDGLEGDVLKEDAYMKHVVPHLGEERAKEIFEKCKGETGEGNCETPFAILICMRKTDDFFKI